MRLEFEDMGELRKHVIELVLNDKIVILWKHIRAHHPEMKKSEITNTLLHGAPIRPDGETEGRYIVWSKLTVDRRLIRVVFEVHKTDVEYVLVVSAFGEE